MDNPSEILVLVSGNDDVAVLVSNTRDHMQARRAAYYAVFGDDPEAIPADQTTPPFRALAVGDDTVRQHTRVMDVHRVDVAYADMLTPNVRDDGHVGEGVDPSLIASLITDNPDVPADV